MTRPLLAKLTSSLLASLALAATAALAPAHADEVPAKAVANFASPLCSSSDFTAETSGLLNSIYTLSQKPNTICVAARPTYMVQVSKGNQDPRFREVLDELDAKHGAFVQPASGPTVSFQFQSLLKNEGLLYEQAGSGILVQRDYTTLNLAGNVVAADPLTAIRWSKTPVAQAYPPAVKASGKELKINISKGATLVGANRLWSQNRPANFGKLFTNPEPFNSVALEVSGNELTLNSSGDLVGSFHHKGQKSSYYFNEGYVIGNRVGRDKNQLVGIQIDGTPNTLNLGKNFVTPSLTVANDKLTDVFISGKVVGSVQLKQAEVFLDQDASVGELDLQAGIVHMSFDPALINKRVASCKAQDLANALVQGANFFATKEFASDFAHKVLNYNCQLPQVVTSIGNHNPNSKDINSWPILRLYVPEGQTWTLDLSKFLTMNFFDEEVRLLDRFEKEQAGLERAITDLQTKISKNQEALTKAQDSLEQKQTTLTQAHAKLEELSAEPEAELSKQEMTQRNKDKAAATKAVASLEKDLATLTKQVQSLTDQLDDDQTHVKTLQQSHDQAEAPKPTPKEGLFLQFSRIEKDGPGTLKLTNQMAQNVPTRIYVMDGKAEFVESGLVLEELDYFQPGTQQLEDLSTLTPAKKGKK